MTRKRDPNPILDIVIDTDEKQPWQWPSDLVHTTRHALKVYDYALADDPLFAIERKSLGDFASSIGRDEGWANMLDRIDRMNGAGKYKGNPKYPPMLCCPMIVEATREKMWERYGDDGRLAAAAQGRGDKITAQFLGKRAAMLHFLGVPVYFAGPPHVAACVAYTFLRQRYRQLEAEANATGKGQPNA